MTEPVSGSVPEPDFAAFVGIDWADQKHCWKLAVAGTHVTEKGELKQTPEICYFRIPKGSPRRGGG